MVPIKVGDVVSYLMTTSPVQMTVGKIISRANLSGASLPKFQIPQEGWGGLIVTSTGRRGPRRVTMTDTANLNKGKSDAPV